MRYLVALAFSVACSGAPTPEPPSRVAAVSAAKVDAKDVAGFCEKHDAADTARPFAWPPLAGAAPPAATGWRWVSVWATWCGPCIAEMPQLLKWRQRLADSGSGVDLQFLSVDDNGSLVKQFLAKHPDLPIGELRTSGSGVLGDWLTSAGLDPAVAIPLHFFVDPSGKTRCVRTGAIDAGDYEVVRGVLSGL